MITLDESPKQMVGFEALGQLDLRVGRILASQPLSSRCGISHVVKLDLGWLGIKQVALQLNGKLADLAEKRVICVVNLPGRSRGGIISEVAVLHLDNGIRRALVVSEGDEARPGSPISW